jgi:hypothetical protein
MKLEKGKGAREEVDMTVGAKETTREAVSIGFVSLIHLYEA